MIQVARHAGDLLEVLQQGLELGAGLGWAVTAGAHPAIPNSIMLIIKKKNRERFMVVLLLELVFI